MKEDIYTAMQKSMLLFSYISRKSRWHYYNVKIVVVMVMKLPREVQDFSLYL